MSRIITPPAKFCAVPLSAIPTANVAEAKSAMIEVTFTPSVWITLRISNSEKTTRIV